LAELIVVDGVFVDPVVVVDVADEPGPEVQPASAPPALTAKTPGTF
jgi:hypothetical protein